MWARYLILGALSLIFLAFGILFLVSSYHQNHPIVFLAMFFSSSLIVLISAACLIGLIWRALTPAENPEEQYGK